MDNWEHIGGIIPIINLIIVRNYWLVCFVINFYKIS